MIQLSMELEKIKEYIDILDEREKVIVKRFGLGLDKEKTQREIAKALGISRSYVSRIEKRALMKMFHEFVRAEKKKKRKVKCIRSSHILKGAAFLIVNKKRKRVMLRRNTCSLLKMTDSICNIRRC